MPSSAVRAALAAVVLALGASGCGGGDSTPAADSAQPTSGSSADPSGEAATASTPSASPTPSVEPATGQLIETEYVSLRGMPEWTSYYDDLGIIRLSSEQSSGRDAVSISHWGAGIRANLRERARMEIEGKSQGRVLQPVELAGHRWFHVTYRDAGSVTHAFGTDGRPLAVTIRIAQLPRRPEAEQQRIVDSILATVTLKQP